MSFSVRFNAEDEEVEGLCTTPHLAQHAGLIENNLKTPEQPSSSTHHLGLFGLKRSSSSDAEQSPCDTTIKRLDSYLSDIQEDLWKNKIFNHNKLSKFEEIQKDTDQLSSDISDTNWYTIRHRGTKVITQIEQFEDVETAKDALEDINITTTKSIQSLLEIDSEAFLTRNRIQFCLFLLLGIITCYLSFKLLPFYLNTFMLGGFITFKFRYLLELMVMEDYQNKQNLQNINNSTDNEPTILKTVQALFHMNPHLMLYKGWMNQFLYEYRPETYRLSLTISAYVKLKGSILIMSYPYYKVPKRSLYNERKPKLLFVKECMYDLTRCNIVLLPQNLVNKRKWSKKYPICIELHADSLIGVRRSTKSKRFIKDTDEWYNKDYITPSKQAENFYKEMIEGEVIDIMDDYDFKDGIFYSENDKKSIKTELGSTKDQKMCELEQTTHKISEKSINLEEESDVDGVWKTDSDKIYLFARNDPEKELWYHRLSLAVAFNASNEIFYKKKTEGRFKLQKAYLAYIHNVHELSNTPISVEKEKISSYQINDISQEQLFLWLNMLLGRICFDYLQNPKVLELVTDRFQKKLNAIRLPKVMDMIVIRSLCFGKGEIPTIRCASTPWVDHRGLWFELGVVYNGTFQASVDTKLNLMKLKKEETQQPKEEMRSAFYDSNQEDSGETSNDEGQAREDVNFAQRLFEQQALNEPPPLQGSRITRFVENMSSSLFELKYVKRVLENVAKKELTLVIDVKQLIGTLIVNIPPPPSDRIWISFKGCPQINFEAKPKVNDTNVPLIDFLTKWLHNVLIKEFEKIIVLPNMTDFTIPMMNSECQN